MTGTKSIITKEILEKLSKFIGHNNLLREPSLAYFDEVEPEFKTFARMYAVATAMDRKLNLDAEKRKIYSEKIFQSILIGYLAHRIAVEDQELKALFGLELPSIDKLLDDISAADSKEEKERLIKRFTKLEELDKTLPKDAKDNADLEDQF